MGIPYDYSYNPSTLYSLPFTGDSCTQPTLHPSHCCCQVMFQGDHRALASFLSAHSHQVDAAPYWEPSMMPPTTDFLTSYNAFERSQINLQVKDNSLMSVNHENTPILSQSSNQYPNFFVPIFTPEWAINQRNCSNDSSNNLVNGFDTQASHRALSSQYTDENLGTPRYLSI
jgi:hypothetical protein